MPTSVQPIIATSDLERLRRFYADVLGATELHRVPAEGPVFYLGLRVGDAELGLVDNESVTVGTPGRILLSIDVDGLGRGRVDDVLSLVEAAGGRVQGPANDMPWGQRVAHVADPDGNAVNLTEAIAVAPTG